MRLARIAITISILAALAFASAVTQADTGDPLPKKFAYRGGSDPGIQVGSSKKKQFTVAIPSQFVTCDGGSNAGKTLRILGGGITKNKQARIGKTYGVSGEVFDGRVKMSGKVFFKSKKKAIAKNFTYKEESHGQFGGGTCELQIAKQAMQRTL